MLQINHKTRRIYDILYFCFCESIMAKTRPTYIVLDTNVLLRLLILDYGTKENIGIPALAQAAEIRITLALIKKMNFGEMHQQCFKSTITNGRA